MALICATSPDDFLLSEDGRPQRVRYFAKQSDLPLKLGLLVDASATQQNVMNAEGAASQFFDDVLRLPDDRVFLMQFDMNIYVKQEFTANIGKLADAMVFVDRPSMRNTGRKRAAPARCFMTRWSRHRRTSWRAQRGRKALVRLTDGVDTGSDASLNSAIEAALKADTLIHSTLSADRGYYALGENGRKVLMEMSKETGGRFFEVSKKEPLDHIFGAIEEELRSSTASATCRRSP